MNLHLKLQKNFPGEGDTPGPHTHSRIHSQHGRARGQVPSVLGHILLCWCGASLIFGRPFVKWFALWYRVVVCLPVCFVTLVYCGQTVGWIKMLLVTEVGLGPGDIVLDGDPAPPHENGHSSSPTFRPSQQLLSSC